MLPPVSRPPAATSVLDLQHEHHPEFFGRAELAYRKFVYGWTIRRSRIVIAISEHARQTLLERYDLPPDRVRTIHLGIDHARFRPDTSGVSGSEPQTPGGRGAGHPNPLDQAVDRAESVAEVEQNGGSGSEPQSSTGPFLLYPARAWPHKNHARLFEAFALLRRERPELRLVLTNYEGPRRTASSRADACRRTSSQSCTAPPLRSSFQACTRASASRRSRRWPAGVRSRARTSPRCPRSSDGAARLFDPTSPEEIAEAVEDVLNHPERWIQAGLRRAAEFTWDACAYAHDKVYRELAS